MVHEPGVVVVQVNVTARSSEDIPRECVHLSRCAALGNVLFHENGVLWQAGWRWNNCASSSSPQLCDSALEFGSASVGGSNHLGSQAGRYYFGLCTSL